MDFIISVFGANVVIGFGVFFWIFMFFFTLKNVFKETYLYMKSDKKRCFDGCYYSFDTVRCCGCDSQIFSSIVLSLFFPFTYIGLTIWLVSKCFCKIITTDLPYAFKALDWVTPSVSIKLEKEDK